jgi:hypothetical protein
MRSAALLAGGADQRGPSKTLLASITVSLVAAGIDCGKGECCTLIAQRGHELHPKLSTSAYVATTKALP